MKKFTRYLAFAANIAVLFIAARWYTSENWAEPTIVILLQLLSLWNLFTSDSGNISLSGFTNTKFDARHEGSGDLNADNLKDSDVKVNK